MIFITLKSCDFEVCWSASLSLGNLAISKFGGESVCMFVCLLARSGSQFWSYNSHFPPITLSLFRIEKERILTKSVAFSHSFDHFSYFK